MAVRLNPYLNFREQTREAMEFYQSVFGGELTVSTFADFGVEAEPDESGKVMHSQLEAPNGLTVMAADTPNSMDYTVGTAHAISLSGDDDAVLRGYWDGLCEGGNVVQPLERAPWGDSFGTVIDKFGIMWLVNISGAPQV